MAGRQNGGMGVACVVNTTASPWKEPPMTNNSEALDSSLAQARLLNARRYGLTQKHLSQFSDILHDFGGEKGGVSDPAVQDVPELSSGDLIKDYIKRRVTDRMYASLEEGRNTGMYAPDDMTSPQDMILDLMGAPHKKSSDISGLLNMHFDLNTLQMLSSS